MIFRITQKLAKKIKVAPSTEVVTADNPFLDWTGHLFYANRVNYIILTNSHSLYTVLFVGRGISTEKEFIENALRSMRDYMVIDKTGSIFNLYIKPHAGHYTFGKANDKHVLGSMNDLIFQAKVDLISLRLPLLVVNQRLNETPMSYIGHTHPRFALMEVN